MFQRKEYQPVSNIRSITEILDDEDMPSEQLKQRLHKSSTSDGILFCSSPYLLESLIANLDPSFWKPNTTYLMCSDIHQVKAPGSHTSGSQDTNISFLIPPTTLGEPDAQENMLLAVTCKVTDVVMVPMKETM